MVVGSGDGWIGRKEMSSSSSRGRCWEGGTRSLSSSSLYWPNSLDMADMSADATAADDDGEDGKSEDRLRASCVLILRGGRRCIDIMHRCRHFILANQQYR